VIQRRRPPDPAIQSLGFLERDAPPTVNPVFGLQAQINATNDFLRSPTCLSVSLFSQAKYDDREGTTGLIVIEHSLAPPQRA